VTVVAGLRFSFEPEGALDLQERDIIRRLPAEQGPPEQGTGPPEVRVRVEPWSRGVSATPTPGPAAVSWDGTRLRLAHATFDAEIDAGGATAVLRRHAGSAVGLVATMRTALSARLPIEGGVLVHAAAFDRGGQGLVFFGPSGIGKSTLSARSPWPVLSDELVAVLPAGKDEAYRVAGAAFPSGPLEGAEPSDAPRLASLVELAQGPRFRLERLDARTALRRLLGSIVVPPAPPSWSAALGVAGDLARRVPCYRMAWSLDEDPLERLALRVEAEQFSQR
jgi:hypothetical protein